MRVLATASAPVGLQSCARIVLTSTSPEPISDVCRQRVADAVTNHSCSVFPATNAVVVICQREAVGDVYKTLRAAAQAGLLGRTSLPPVKQSIRLKDISQAELREAVTCALHRALLASNHWHWWTPGSQLADVALFHEQSALVDSHTLTLDVQLQGDQLQLLCTVGKIKYRPCSLAHVLSSTRQTMTQSVPLDTLLTLANAQLPVEGNLCCLLPHGQHAMLAGFVRTPPNPSAAQRLRQQLVAAGHEGIPDPPYWAVVRGSDDPDSPEACVLPGMVVSAQGIVTRPVTAHEAQAVVQTHIMPHLAAMPRNSLWAGAPVQVTSVLQCCQEDPCWGGVHDLGQARQPVVHTPGEQRHRVEMRPTLAARLAAIQASSSVQHVVPRTRPPPPLPLTKAVTPLLKRRGGGGHRVPVPAGLVGKPAYKAPAAPSTKAPKKPKAEVDVAAVAARLAAHARAGTTATDVTLPELKALLKSMGKAVGGKKADLLKRAMEE